MLLLVVAPSVLGVFTGLALGLSEGVYLFLNVIAAVGGVLAGLEHRGARGGALRGVVGGLLFGVFILLTHALSGAPAKATLPSPLMLLVVFTGVAGALLGTLGGFIRGRSSENAER